MATSVQDLDRVYRTVAAILDTSTEMITDASSPDTIAAWDSLNHLNLVMALEQEFGVSLSAGDALVMSNVASIRTILRQYGVEC